MRRYRQILAGFLAANMILNTVTLSQAAEETTALETFSQILEEESTPETSVNTVQEITQQEAEEQPVESENLTVVTETQAAASETIPPEPSVETVESTASVPESSTSAEVNENTSEISTTLSDTSQEESLESDSSNESNSTEIASSEVSESEIESEELESESESEEESEEESESESEEEIALYAGEDGYINWESYQKYNTSVDSDNKTMNIQNEKELIILSNCDPSKYADYTINITVTGLQADLTGEIEETLTDENGNSSKENYSYKGLGSDTYPFKGKLTGRVPFLIKCALFNGVSSNVQIDSTLGIKWGGDGTSAMFAEEYIFESTNGDTSHSLPISIAPKDNTTSMGPVIGTLTAAEGVTGHSLVIEETKVTYEGSTKITIESGNAGLICNTMKSGTIELENYRFPASYEIIAKNGNAGGLVGQMDAGTFLYVNGGTITPSVTANTGNAGGLVGEISGEVGKNAEIHVTSDFTINKPQITSNSEDGKAGGLAGNANSVSFSNENIGKLSIQAPIVKGVFVGGLFGYYTNEIENAELPSWIVIGNSAENLVTVTTAVGGQKAQNNVEKSGTTKAGGAAGGLFGILDLKNGFTYSITLNNDVYSKEVGVDGQSYISAYGSIVGFVKSDTIVNSLCIDGANKKIVSECKKNNAYYHGGLIGKVGENSNNAVYVEIKNNVEITVKQPFASQEVKGFGGIVGYLTDGSILKVSEQIKINTSGGYDTPDSKIWEGGGVVGYAGKGSVVELSGITDLSGVWYMPSIHTGQLVGKQDCALIYAKGDGNGTGWTYIRAEGDHLRDDAAPNRMDSLDDIGNYGQVFRLKKGATTGLDDGFITINSDTHGVTLTTDGLVANGDEVQIGSAGAYAALSIIWQSQGQFGSNFGIVWSDLQNKNIKLTASIDLTGTGAIGLTRDDSIEDDKNTYNRTFDGGMFTLKLAIGETYGIRDGQPATGASSGQICRHQYTGLFAAANGTVKDVTIAGEISLDARTQDRGLNTDRIYYLGGYTSYTTGNITAENVTASETIKVSAVNTNGRLSKVYAGGLLGYISSDASIELGNQDTAAVVGKATINVIKQENITNSSYDNIYAGGVIGALAGDKTIIVNCNKVELGGTINSSANGSYLDGNDAAQVGGLIGLSEYGRQIKKINISNIIINNQTITASSAKRSGGLLGYLWADTDVTFEPNAAAEGEQQLYALSVQNGRVNAAQAEAGGLVYRASGKWTVEDYGISMTSGSFTADKLGLLVCHAENDETNTDSNKWPEKALYFEMKANWENAYKLSSEITIENATVFDEIIAYTAKNAAYITENGRNGIISLATKSDDNGNREGVALGKLCNTYQNQTSYHIKTNLNSRYYYNLDTVWKTQNEQKQSEWVNTKEKLLMWSVWRYASSSLKGYFKPNITDNITTNGNTYNNVGQWIGAGTDDENTANFDMCGLSYYPINASGLYVNNARIIFDNEHIENLETTENNKRTTGSTDDHTQHYMMHCGLFYNMIGGDKSTTTTIYKISFEGTVGIVNGGSGALCCGTIVGWTETMSVHTVDITDISLDGICVYNITEETGYAPVLINLIDSYASLNLDYVNIGIKEDNSSRYEANAIAGTSLIGCAGNSNTQQISLSFNRMTLPDQDVAHDGIFTRATFLERFQYSADSVGTAVYNFYKNEDWDNGTHIYKVTYGKEISHSTEYGYENSDDSTYDTLQEWYYDEETYETSAGWVQKNSEDGNEKPDFSDYLPYVKNGYDSDTNCHEIMVNQRVGDLVTGCGTYGHPYVITSALQMNTIANYIATGTARTGWKVTITSNQSELHAAEGKFDETYEYDEKIKQWKQIQKNEQTDSEGKTTITWKDVDSGKRVANTDMHRYLLSGYYDIQASAEEGQPEKKIELKDFVGFGTVTYPFRGVLVSTNGSIIELNGSNSSSGLIPYSYGCVVKDLTIRYTNGTKTVAYSTKDDSNTEDETTSSILQYLPQAFWGGVIGCIVGGDSIIDNVAVTWENWSLTLAGTKSYLIEIGGYVGSVAGGGVIFRNMTGKTVYTSDEVTNLNYFYVNPIVGRVLDGYAFSEDKAWNSANQINGVKNYQISDLDPADKECIVTTTTTDDNSAYSTQIKDAQGLLILSAIINSGAASGGNVYAYSDSIEKKSNLTTNQYSFGNGIYGKVRNASYKFVGKVNSSDESTENGFTTEVKDDFSISIKDEKNVLSSNNAPYLVTAYATGETFNICSTRTEKGENTVLFELTSGATYDMTSYGNGYQGISARYMSSAAYAGTDKLGTLYVKPCITGFYGVDAKGETNIIKADMQIKEYVDDDFHGISFGAVFNLIWAKDAGNLKDGIIAKNFKLDGTIVTLNYYKFENSNVSEVDAASTVGMNEAGSDVSTMTPELYCVGVGGFAGNSAQNATGDSADANYVFKNIAINNSVFKGPISAGALMGSAGLGGYEIRTGIGRLMNRVIYTYNDANNAKTKNRNTFGVNLEDCSYNKITVTAKYAAGGFVGNVDAGINTVSTSGVITDYKIFSYGEKNSVESSLKVTTDQKEIGCNSTITAANGAAGGIFGIVSTQLKINASKTEEGDECAGDSIAVLKNVNVEANLSADSTRNSDAGGVVGHIEQNNCSIYNVTVKKEETASTTSIASTAVSPEISGVSNAGGIVGYLSSNDKKIVIEKCDISGYTIKKAIKAGVGGIVGALVECIGDKEMLVKNCTVSNLDLNGNGAGISVGGIAGVYEGRKGGDKTKTQPFIIQGCKVESVQINSSNRKGGWNGGLVGSMGYADNEKLSVYDSIVKQSDIYGSCVGGITSSIHGYVDGANILIDNVQLFSGSDEGAGIVAAQVGRWFYSMRIAGISVKNSNIENIVDPAPSHEKGFEFNTKSYIAFADYTDAAQSTGDKSNAGTGDNLLNQKGVAPYVTTSPKSDISVREDNQDKYLFGDGACFNGELIWQDYMKEKQTGEDQTQEDQAQEDQAQEEQTQKDGKFVYENTGVADFKFTGMFSTYNENQEQQLKNNFTVLQITGGDTSKIKDYLDILTNGGYSQALQMGEVSAKTELYEFTETSSEISKSEDEESSEGSDTTVSKVEGVFIKNATKAAPLIVENPSTKTMAFQTSTDYDNDQNRFTLLTVTFAVNSNHQYQIQIPVIVRRELEVDFTATLSYGTHFESTYYDGLKDHILDSFNSTMTAYLTYTFNSKEGTTVPYGWQKYAEAGGDMTQVLEKVIVFGNSKMPVGTQLTLIDCQSKDRRAYTYTVTENSIDRIALSEFKTSGKAGEAYSSRTIGEQNNVTMDGSVENGSFIKVGEDGKPVGYSGTETKFNPPTIKTVENGEICYYRRRTDTETNYKGYSVSTTDQSETENYYLVITIPGDKNSAAVNGAIQTDFEKKSGIPYEITDLLRQSTPEDIQPDSHLNTASTYQIFSGYTQTLQENLTSTQIVKKMSVSDSIVKVAVKDRIEFSTEQYYLTNDQLYLKFTGVLKNIVNNAAETSESAVQFPSGTNGTVKFYVYTQTTDGSGSVTGTTYYKYENGSWRVVDNNDNVATSYTWISDGGNMELPLCNAKGNLISLREIRDKAKANSSGIFFVEAVLDASIPAAGLDVIPESELPSSGLLEKYAKMTYLSQLSTVKEGLSYSNSKAKLDVTRMQYYRDAEKEINLKFDADSIGQLGINLLDLEHNLDKDKKNALIDTTAIYDLSSLQDLESVLKASSGIRFTLTLSQKDNVNKKEEYLNHLTDAEDYINVQITSSNATSASMVPVNGTWTWTIPSDKYVKTVTGQDGEEEKQLIIDAENDVFDGSHFIQKIRLLVNISNVEKLEHFYSNYEVTLTAEVLQGENGTVDGTLKSNNIIYTLAKIKPEFVDPDAGNTGSSN